MQYRVKLPDHDWVVAERHKLIPSVYSIIDVAPNRMMDRSAVGYSGPTYITIRSGKHSSSTAYSHAKDIQDMFDIEQFRDQVRSSDGKVKPVLLITTDGGPDENPRYTRYSLFVILQINYKNNLNFLKI